MEKRNSLPFQEITEVFHVTTLHSSPSNYKVSVSRTLIKITMQIYYCSKF